MYITRTIEKELIELGKKYPVVTITGPRQSGKTTLVKNTYSDYKYFNLEKPDTLDYALNDPNAFLSEGKEGMIIDEIQYAPQLLSYIQVIVDESQKTGQFILTGSQQFQLMKGVTQSLAGRTALLKVLPFSFSEISNIQDISSVDDLILTGFYPRVWDKTLDPTKTYRDYFETYIQRDLRELINVKDLRDFRRFVKLCAGRSARIFEATSLANDVGVSVTTIKSWLSALESSYIVFLLEPYYENFGKRLIKSPKLYFYDVGLACYLLGIENTSQLNRDPLRGELFENMIVIELLKQRYNNGKESNLYYYRDNHKNEVDLLLKFANEFKSVEIKSSSSFHSDFIKGNEYLEKIIGERLIQKYLVYTGIEEMNYKNNLVKNYKSIQDINFAY